ncbi:MAG: hypothetical protein ACYSWO_30050 [Planctomycetota bacterium]|jgi:hypothetical protein
MKNWPPGSYDHIIGKTGNIAVLALDDPATPVIVLQVKTGETATYDCAHGTGEVDCYQLTDTEWAMLDFNYNKAEEWFDQTRPDGWEG